MAGAQYLDCMMLFGVSEAAVYKSILKTLLPLPGLSTTHTGRIDAATSFVTSRRVTNPLKGCTEAVDGILIKIDKPFDVPDPAQYYNRKGYHAIPVQAIVDHRYRFRYMSATCVGSTHGALTFVATALARQLEQGLILRPFYLVGDNAYVCEDWMLTPVTSARALPGTPADACNFSIIHAPSELLVIDDYVAYWMNAANEGSQQGRRYDLERNTDELRALELLVAKVVLFFVGAAHAHRGRH
eukprot:IDg5627t1